MTINTVDPMIPEFWEKNVQEFHNKTLIGMKIANTKFAKVISNGGDKIHFSTLSDMSANTRTVGSDNEIQEIISTDDTMDINIAQESSFSLDKFQEKQIITNDAERASIQRQQAQALANQIDTRIIKSGVDNATTTSTVATGINIDNLSGIFRDSRTSLQRLNIQDNGDFFAVIDPARSGIIGDVMISNGYNEADNALRNSFAGRFRNFNTFVSNNLPSSVPVTFDTQPTAGKTFTILGVTFTFVADGASTSAGEISIGADLADFKTIFPDALNVALSTYVAGAGASSYGALGKVNKDKLKNAIISASAFVGDVITITGTGYMNTSMTEVGGTNAVGTETTKMLFGKMGAVSTAIQIQPSLTITQEPRRSVKNFLLEQLYGVNTFERAKDKLVAVTINQS